MFRLVARQGLEETADKTHNSIGLFMFLLRAHAESMSSRSDIEAWAESIVTSNGGNDKDRAGGISRERIGVERVRLVEVLGDRAIRFEEEVYRERKG